MGERSFCHVVRSRTIDFNLTVIYGEPTIFADLFRFIYGRSLIPAFRQRSSLSWFESTCPAVSARPLRQFSKATWCEVMALRVGRVPHLNFEPFYIDMERRGVVLCNVALNDIAEAIKDGTIDGGPVPLSDSFAMEDYAVPVAGFCLSAAARSGSNLFYSRVPAEELDGRKVAVSEADPTTIELLRVILTKKYQVNSVELVTPQDENEALVISGDAALRRRRGMRGYPHRYDLGEEWHRLTDLPFVFARWMSRSNLAHRDFLLLEDTLYVGLEDGVDSLFHISEPRDNLLMLARDVMEYIIGYRYFVGLSEQKSIDLFRRYRDQVLG